MVQRERGGFNAGKLIIVNMPYNRKRVVNGGGGREAAVPPIRQRADTGGSQRWELMVTVAYLNQVRSQLDGFKRHFDSGFL
jgi:hypothetical protein